MTANASMTIENQQALAREVLAGNKKAIEELERLLRPPICELSKRTGNLRPQHEHRDGVDLVLLYLMTGVRQQKTGFFNSSPSPLEKWLTDPGTTLIGWCLVCARNYLVDLRRLRELPTLSIDSVDHTDTRLSDNTFADHVLDELFTKEVYRAVRDIYDHLPPHERRILILKYHDGWTDAQIALKFGIAESTARKHRSRAEQKFRRLFLDKYPQFTHDL